MTSDLSYSSDMENFIEDIRVSSLDSPSREDLESRLSDLENKILTLTQTVNKLSEDIIDIIITQNKQYEELKTKYEKVGKIKI